jgi:hypothetical protein
LTFAYLESDQDAEKYQGWNLTWIGVEELTTFARPEPLFRLMATLRSPNPDLKVCFRATANPGGPGTTWVKRRYIDPAPLGYKIITDPETGLQRCFIPARATDNKYISNDYMERIKLAAPNEGVLRGWLYGDWNIAEGAFFDEFDVAKHVVPQFRIPGEWPRFMAFDPGSSDPAAALWAAIVPDAYEVNAALDTTERGQGRGVRIPKEALVVYRELYIAKEVDGGHVNVGLKWPIERVAEGICKAERFQTVRGGRYVEPVDQNSRPKMYRRVADPFLFHEDGGPSMAERMARASGYQLNFSRADNKRVPGKGRMSGWNMVRHRLQGKDGRPMLYVMQNCVDLIRTFPMAQIDEAKPEDVAEGEDHLIDCCRYICMARPFVPSNISESAKFESCRAGSGGIWVTPPPLDDAPDRPSSLYRRI